MTVKEAAKTIHLRQDRYFILGAYRDKLKELRNIGLGNTTNLGNKVTIQLINIIQKRYDELQIRWRVYGIYK